ncbi:hypothetical protein RSSM_06658 [Rhodopirellula sallentina SM41]|uniref:Uncharacterized protein n=1 Tax=Rhodopirellula sallentina SM41 TaxID=1263870 RepID=M5U246_9BACT|nr:hypothetical protein RSSM_06658 [Rhodopirellula sallentina SM41]
MRCLSQLNFIYQRVSRHEQESGLNAVAKVAETFGDCKSPPATHGEYSRPSNET